MPTSSLFRMDDFLLKGAAYLGVAVVCAAVGIWAVVQGGGIHVPRPVLAGVTAFAFAPVAMGVTGSGIRKRERRALSLWKIIDREVEISAADLLRGSDWTATALDRAIRDLNNAGVTFIVWDRKSGLVQNGRLRRSTLLVDECTACSGKMSVQVTIGGTSAVLCPYCNEPIDVARIAEEKARIIDELEDDGRSMEVARPIQSSSESGGFNLFVFIVLFTVFWPAGIWYCVKHRTHLASLLG